MPRFQLSPVKAFSRLAPRTWFAVLALVLAGCSSRPMATAPQAADPDGFGREVGSATLPKKSETVVVTLTKDQDAAALASQYGAVLVGNGSSWRVAGLQPLTGTADALIVQLDSDPRVLTVEKNAVFEPAEIRQKSWAFDDGWGSAEACEYQPATYSCGLHEAHQVSKGAGVLVAVLDTGADGTHAWLSSRVVGGYDFVAEDTDPSETPDGYDNDYDGGVDEGLGHGTHVSGIVALAAPEAGLLIARVLNSDGCGDMMNVARGVRWAVANGAKVINLSLGGLETSEAVTLAMQEASAAGALCVASAGNWGASQPVEFPAKSRYAIAVAAVDDQDVLAPFSSYGDFVDLCAPGVAIRSSYRDGGYAQWSGTSMSTPWVSGGVALVLAKNPDWNFKQAKDRILETARPIWKQNPARRGDIGAGTLDLGKALSDVVVSGEKTRADNQ